MKIIFFGTPSFVTPLLTSLQKHFDVIAVVTAPDKKAGRKQLLTPSAVKLFSQQTNNTIPILTPQKCTNDFLQEIRSLKPDLFVVAAYGQILPKTLLEIPPFGAINIHPSLLPKYRGATPVQTTLLKGEHVTGVTIIKMDEEMDHGPILGMNSYTIHETDTSETLLTHLFLLSATMLPEVIMQYTSGTIDETEQDHTQATYTKKITKEDGQIMLTKLPEKKLLKQMIHAYYPWPGVWTKLSLKKKETRLKFLPGGKVQLEGKNPVTIDEFIKGYPEVKKYLEDLDLDQLN